MTRKATFTFRRFVAAVGFALAATCVLQVVCYRVVDRGLGVEPVVVVLGLPVLVAALCVRDLRPDEPRRPLTRWTLRASILVIYFLTALAFVPVAFLRDAWVFEGVEVAPRWMYEWAFRAVVGCTAVAAVFGAFCLGCLVDKWLFRDAAKPAEPPLAEGGSGVYAGACRSGPAPVSPGSYRIRPFPPRHPCE